MRDLFELAHKELLIKSDGTLVRKRSVGRAVAGQEAGWLGNNGYISLSLGGRKYLAHRIVFLMTHGFMPDQVDHINGVRTDNRPENLRASDATTNKWNSANASKRSSTGVRGVSWHKAAQKYCVQIMCNGSKKYLGLTKLWKTLK